MEGWQTCEERPYFFFHSFFFGCQHGKEALQLRDTQDMKQRMIAHDGKMHYGYRYIGGKVRYTLLVHIAIFVLRCICGPGIK